MRAERLRKVVRDLGMLFLQKPIPAPLLLDYSEPDDLAFLAMTYHRLGHKDKAQATLARLRNVADKNTWCEAEALIEEAEALIEGESAESKK